MKKQQSTDPNYHIAHTNRNALMVRRNQLLEAKYTLTETEHHFVSLMTAQIQRDDEEFKTFRITVKDWFQVRNRKLIDDPYSEVIRLQKRLTQRTVGLPEGTTKGKRKYHSIPWFAIITYIEGDGMIEAKFNNELRPFLLQLTEQFTPSKLNDALVLKGDYAKRIYDFVIQYLRAGKRRIALDHLHEMLETTDKYPRFADFRRFVLEPSHKQINGKTSVSYDWVPEKTVRRVTHIYFFDIQSKDDAIEISEATTDNPELVERLVDHLGHASADTAMDIVATYDADRIEWHIAEFERLADAGKEKGTGWLIDGIKDDYRPKKSPRQLAKLEKRKEERAELAAAAELRKAVQKVHNACIKAEDRKVTDFIENMSDDERSVSEAEFVTKLRSNPNAQTEVTLRRYETDGIEHSTVDLFYRIYVRDCNDHLKVDRVAYARDNGFSDEVIAAYTANPIAGTLAD